MVTTTRQTAEWFARLRAGDACMRERIAVAHQPLVVHIAKKYAARTGWRVTAAELFGAGCCGLLKGIDAFDPGRGVTFRSYAGRRIDGAILDDLRSRDWVKRRGREKRRGGHVREMILASDYEPDDRRHGEFLQDVAVGPAADPCDLAILADEVRRLLRGLRTRDKVIFWLYYAEALTCKQVGGAVGLCESRVAQRLGEIREHLAAKLGRPVPGGQRQ